MIIYKYNIVESFAIGKINAPINVVKIIATSYLKLVEGILI